MVKIDHARPQQIAGTYQESPDITVLMMVPELTPAQIDILIQYKKDPKIPRRQLLKQFPGLTKLQLNVAIDRLPQKAEYSEEFKDRVRQSYYRADPPKKGKRTTVTILNEVGRLHGISSYAVDKIIKGESISN